MPRSASAGSDQPRVDWQRWAMPQQWDRFTPDQHGIWDRLFERQMAILRNRIVERFFDGIVATGLDRPGIPDMRRLNARLRPLTGWSVVAVPGLVPDDVFYSMLIERQFPAGNFIRRPDQLDYIQEPDLFHDIFGHVPMLADPAFAELGQHFGRIGLAAVRAGRTELVARLYWHTVEFGLTREDGQCRIFGGGLASSKGEAVYAVESEEPDRLPMHLARVINTPYRIDRFQPTYFVTEDIRALVQQIDALEFEDIAAMADQWSVTG